MITWCVFFTARLELRTAFVLLAFFLISKDLQAADSSALSKQIEDLSKALTTDAAKDDAAQKSLAALLAKIASTDCDADPSKRADCKIAQLIAFSGQGKSVFDLYKTALTIKQQGDLANALQPWLSLPVPNKDAQLTSVLDFAAKQLNGAKLNEPDAIVTSLGGVIASAVPQIVAAKPGGLPKVKIDAMVTSVQADQKALDQILTALSADKRINILGAWYGDIRSIRGEAEEGGLSPWKHPWKYNDRFCSATRAVRTRCQGTTGCYQPGAATPGQNPPANTATSELIGGQLCGYEPAPFADPQNKGVVVAYECVALDPATWKGVGIGEPVKKDPGPPLDALLRYNTIEEIRCQGAPP